MRRSRGHQRIDRIEKDANSLQLVSVCIVSILSILFEPVPVILIAKKRILCGPGGFLLHALCS
jgi:hypothetical protein